MGKNEKVLKDMTESLGNHLRNLMGSYRTLLDRIEFYKKTKDVSIIDSFNEEFEEAQFERMIDFSKSKPMEENLWRDKNGVLVDDGTEKIVEMKCYQTEDGKIDAVLRTPTKEYNLHDCRLESVNDEGVGDSTNPLTIKFEHYEQTE